MRVIPARQAEASHKGECHACCRMGACRNLPRRTRHMSLHSLGRSLPQLRRQVPVLRLQLRHKLVCRLNLVL